MREVTTGYIQEFVKAISRGNPTTYMVAGNLLAVDHPALGPLVLQLADKVVDSKEIESKTSDS